MLPRSSVLLAVVSCALATSGLACSSGSGSSPDTPAADDAARPGRTDGNDTKTPAEDAGAAEHEAGSSDSAAPSAPTLPYLATRWYSAVWHNQDLTGTSYYLKADGTGILFTTVTRPLIPYGAGDTSSQTNLTWSATSTTLTIDGTPHPFVLSPNCALLEMDNEIFEGGSTKGCPTSVPPLTAVEAPMVGHWFYYAPNGQFGYASLDVTLEDSRLIHLQYEPDGDPAGSDAWDILATATVDADGTLHAIEPDGSDPLPGATLAVDGATLTLCFGACLPMTKL